MVYGAFEDVFDIPEYREAMAAYRGLEEDVAAQALQRMMERQAAMGTLRAGGITDYPTLDILREKGRRIGQYGARMAETQALTKARREEAATAFERQKQLMEKQFEFQKQLIDYQYQKMKEAQPSFWERMGESLGGALLGAFTSPLTGLAGAVGQAVFGGLMPRPRIPAIKGLTATDAGVLLPEYQALMGLSPWQYQATLAGMERMMPIMNLMMYQKLMQQQPIDWGALLEKLQK